MLCLYFLERRKVCLYFIERRKEIYIDIDPFMQQQQYDCWKPNMTVGNQLTCIKINVTNCIDPLKQNLRKIKNLILRNKF